MPWKVVQAESKSCPYEVVRSDTGARVGCHETEQQALNHVAALYANMPESMRARERAKTPKEYSHISDFADPGYLDSAGNQAKGGNGVKRYPIDASHVTAAWSYINMPKNQKGYTADQLASVKARIKAAMKRHGHEVSDDDDSSSSSNERAADDIRGLEFGVRSPIETRAATVGEVKTRQRIITTICVPYDRPAPVEYRGQVWDEVFTRNAFDGIERLQRIRANRDHNRERTVGRVARWFPHSNDGLIAEVKIANTDLGEETLTLAEEDCLSASVGYGIHPNGERLDRANRIRQINKAFMDHLAFVENPAFEEASILSVRANSAGLYPPAPGVAPDEWLLENADILRWAADRLGKLQS